MYPGSRNWGAFYVRFALLSHFHIGMGLMVIFRFYGTISKIEQQKWRSRFTSKGVF
jgi:hypothetical protein